MSHVLLLIAIIAIFL